MGGEKVGRDMGGLIRWVGMVGKDLGGLKHTYTFYQEGLDGWVEGKWVGIRVV